MIHAFGSQPHYVDHLHAIWSRLGEYQGKLWSVRERPGASVISLKPTEFVSWSKAQVARRNDWWLVSSFSDLTMLHKAGIRNLIIMEHGIGQAYTGVKHGSYIGVMRDPMVRAYWMPNQIAVDNQQYFTKKPVHLLPAARIEDLKKSRGQHSGSQVRPRVAVSFHSMPMGVPEQQGTFKEWKDFLPALAQRDEFELVAHGHPFNHSQVGPEFNQAGIPFISDFEQIVKWCDVYVCDNSSTQFESAACGLKQVVLNGARYRRMISHGLRFWEFSNIGLNVWGQDKERGKTLLDTILRTISEDPQKARREEIVAELFGHEAPSVEETAFNTLPRSVKISVPENIVENPQENNQEENPVEIFAICTKTKQFQVEGLILEGQVFKPGFQHQQINGEAVPVKQVSDKPHLRLAVLRGTKAAEPFFMAVEPPAPPTILQVPVDDLENPDESLESPEIPVKREGKKNGKNKSRSRQQHDNEDRVEEPPSTE